MNPFVSLLEFFFGANWRTTLAGLGTAVSGLLTAFAALPYQLGPLASVIPPDYKAKVFLVAAISTAILNFLHGAMAKDSVVTGNGTQMNPPNVNDGSATGRTLLVPIGIIILAGFVPLALVACATGADGQRHLKPLSAGQQAALDRVGIVVGAAIQGAVDGAAANAEQQLVTGGKVDPSTLGGSAAIGALGAAIRAATSSSPRAIAQSASNYTTTPGVPPAIVVGVAPTISAAITEAVKAGVPLPLATEAAAKGADIAAQSIGQP